MKSEGTNIIRTLIIGLACLLIASSCSISDDSLTEETTELRIRIDDLISGLEFDVDTADLDGCPFDPALIATLFDGLVAEELTSFADDDDDLLATALQLPISGAALVGCLFVPEESGIGLDFSPAPSSLDSFLREFNDPDQTGTTTFETSEAIEHRGGEFVEVYVSDSEDPIFGGSELYWIDDNVMITAYGFGPGNERLDLDTVRERLITELEDLIVTSP